MANRTLTFGMVNVAVRTGPSLDDSARISGKFADPDGYGPVKQQYANEAGKVVKPVKVYEHDGVKVELLPEDVAKLPVDGTINLEARVERVPSEWILSTALVTPAKGNGPAFDLVADYLRRTGSVFIGRCITSGTTKVLAISWSAVYGAVIEQVLCFAAQVREDKVQAAAAAVGTPDPKLVEMADAIFAAVPTTFDYASVTDAYGEALEAAVVAKAGGKPVPTAAAPVAAKSPDDLMAMLAASQPTKETV
jgi:non-homologous end joining protein Ku